MVDSVRDLEIKCRAMEEHLAENRSLLEFISRDLKNDGVDLSNIDSEIAKLEVGIGNREEELAEACRDLSAEIDEGMKKIYAE